MSFVSKGQVMTAKKKTYCKVQLKFSNERVADVARPI